MAVHLQDLVVGLEQVLQPDKFNDYCPNGLQVAGRAQVSRLVTGVTASLALLEQAQAWQADAVLVHHGYFWKGESAVLQGMKKQRLKLLLQHDISLLAYHLPLDTHPRWGNNRQLAERFGWSVDEPLDEGVFQGLGNIGRLPAAMSLAELGRQIGQQLQREPLLISGGDHPVRRIAWCTGAAQSMIELAADKGVDAYISGEISEPTVHVARERGIHYIAAGHHATERYGVAALGSWLAQQHGLEHRFIDIDNPV